MMETVQKSCVLENDLSLIKAQVIFNAQVSTTLIANFY